MVSIELMVMAALMPILTISAFILGYNMNATKKISLPKPKKAEEKKPTEDEEMLERINNARV